MVGFTRRSLVALSLVVTACGGGGTANPDGADGKDARGSGGTGAGAGAGAGGGRNGSGGTGTGGGGTGHAGSGGLGTGGGASGGMGFGGAGTGGAAVGGMGTGGTAGTSAGGMAGGRTGGVGGGSIGGAAGAGGGTAGAAGGGVATGGAGGGGTGGASPRLTCTPSASWDSEFAFEVPTAASQSDMVVDRAGGLHAAVRVPLDALNAVVSTYRPPGGTWAIPTVVSDSAAASPSIASDANFRTHVAWLGSGNGDPLHYGVSSAGGPWTVALNVDNPALIGPAGMDLVTDPNGNPEVMVTAPGGNGAFLRSNAGTWVQQAIPAAISAGAGLVVDSSGRTLLTYRSSTGLESIIVGVDGSLGAPESIAPVAITNGAAAVLPNGSFVVVYGQGTGVYRAIKAGSAAWSIDTVSATASGLGCQSKKCLVVDSAGRLHTLIVEGMSVSYAHTDANNQWQIEPGGLGGGSVALGIDGAGVLHALVRGADSGGRGSLRHFWRCPAADGGRAPDAVAPTAGTWQERPSPMGPAHRFSGQGLVFDSSQHEMVLFGGRDPGMGLVPPETWTWPTNGSAWVRKAASTGTNPGARLLHGMAFDSARSRVVLLGGGFNTDAWEWDGATATWSSRATSSAPAGLVPAGTGGPATRLVYDSARSKLVVLISGTCPDACWGLYDWDPTTAAFTARTSSEPRPVSLSSIAYDAPSGLVIAYGNGGTWEWNPGTGVWTERTGSAAKPVTGEIVAGGGGRFVIYDGAATWEWTRATAVWRQRALTQVGPAARRDAMTAYHPERQTTWMFGGAGLASKYMVYLTSFRGSPNAVFDTTFEWYGAAQAP